MVGELVLIARYQPAPLVASAAAAPLHGRI